MKNSLFSSTFTQLDRSEKENIEILYTESSLGSTLDTDLSEKICRLGYPNEALIEFFFLAASVYITDKLCLRKYADDNWTRQLKLSLSVRLPQEWREINDHISAAIRFLTGDHWHINFRKQATRLRSSTYGAGLGRFDIVCLLSGGLDSLAGAINLLEEGKRVLFIGHYDAPHTAADQRKIVDTLANFYRPDRFYLVHVRLRPSPQLVRAHKLEIERTTRSRSLVFVALGALFASVLSPQTPICIPENGFLSLNVPLNNCRLGSCSTRTTHPFFLSKVESIFSKLGILNPLILPFEAKTKGEVLRDCKNSDVLRSAAKVSISCAHPEVGRWLGKSYGNCGYCYPCLIRRAAMHKLGWDNSRDYLFDIKNDGSIIQSDNRGRDLRSVIGAISKSRTDPHNLEILTSGPLGNGGSDSKILNGVYARGLNELGKFFSE